MQEWLRLVIAVLATGVLAGGVGILMLLTLRAVEWLAFGHGTEFMLDAVRMAPAWRRFIAVPIGAGLAGLAWWALRRSRPVTDIKGALADPDADFPVVRTTADALLQVLVVGSGTSVGRENAPRQMAASLANSVSRIVGLDWRWRRILIAAGAGAGLAAVYNTPLTAVPFALTVILGEWSVAGVVISLVISAIATPIAWLVTFGEASTALSIGDAAAAGPVYVWAVAAIPLCAGAGWIMRVMCSRARVGARIEQASWRTPVAMAAAGVVTGAVGLWLAQILGNGKSTLDMLFGNVAPIEPVVIGVLCGVFVLKPVLTAVTLRKGVVGGLLMPSAATGAGLGAAVALTLAHVGILDSGTQPMDDVVALFALVAAAGLLAVTQASPLFAVIFALELTHCQMWIWPAVAITGFGSYWLIRLIRRIAHSSHS